MPNDRFVSSLRILMLAAFLAASASTIKPVTATPRAASETYGRLPLHFEANRGQTHEDVRFLARGPGYSLYLTAGEAVLVLARPNPDAKRDAHSTPARLNTQAREAPVVVRMSLVGAAPKPRVSGLEELPGKANYFIGNDPAKWQTSVPTYAKVQYRDVYPGIDVVYYGNQRQLEYDFVVAPRADPQRIVLDFKGVERLEIDAHGELVMHAAGGAIRQHKPVIHQDIDGMRREIAGGYVMKSAHQVAFQVAAYDKTRPLVIDPVLSYSTYLGGSGGDEGWGITVDNLGNAYVTGSTSSTNFPTNLGSFQTASAGNVDAFVTKLNATGSALVYSTYLGGSGSEGGGFGIAVDSLGNAYVTGGTASTDFPVTPGAFQTALAGGSDAFVTKLDATGSALLYSTYLGGSGGEGGMFRIAVDSLGNAYVAGHTASTDFPVTVGAFQTAFVGNVAAFVTKLNATGSALFYSTYLGGSTIQIGGGDFKEGIAIAVDSLGNAYVAGGTTSNTFPTTPGAFQTTFVGGLADAFATKLNATGSALLYSTYLGGSGYEQAFGIALDTLGNAYVTGETGSINFPTTVGAFQTAFGGNSDAFVTKLNATGSALLYSTYLGGGSGYEQAFGIAVDTLGNAYVSGSTTSTNFPTTLGAFQTTFGGGLIDAFATKLNATGSALLYSTYLGGSGIDEGLGIALDTLGNAYVTGLTFSTSFPTTPGAFQTAFGGVEDAFVVKLADIGAPATLVLSPAAATNPVGTSHTVTATVTDAGGNPVRDIVVRFTVTGSVSTSGSCTTGANGQCSFTYPGPALPGPDVITAYADTDGDSTQDVGEPTGGATKIWALPVTTPLCEIKISNGGRITALNGDKASFGGNARSSATGQTSGQQTYQDQGPAEPLTVNALSVLAIVCEGTTQASIYGQATINGSGSFFYRIDVGEPGVGRDTYWILLQNGYNSGQHTLDGGNVQIRRTR